MKYLNTLIEVLRDEEGGFIRVVNYGIADWVVGRQVAMANDGKPSVECVEGVTNVGGVPAWNARDEDSMALCKNGVGSPVHFI